ncbi:Brix-domain-containing protein [Nadsonia fulvescens var. elongata DSM 6958]|uniref:Ribosome production factor 2 homolog n=1 Tax=Nadsonia fulvescens var. elongata DSM 6958 TaxID=857566 RepID=A0A1E3PPS4_9ASCO|nr:Brix-domain-containing protein [Nadsonia fulvescens var. elongata DSM 6958]
MVENVKKALFIPGTTCNKVLHDVMVDLNALKKPDAKRFQKKNDIRPFEDPASLEFFAEKNDSSLLVLGSHNKKRPNNLTFVRTFSFKIYDMIELSLTNYKLLQDFKKTTFAVGLKPMFVFNGPIFDSHPTYQHVKSLFLDFFRGEVTDLQDLAGLQHIISISAAEATEDEQKLPEVYFRTYLLKTYKSGQKIPRVELEEIGPRFDFKVGRVQSADPDMVKEAMKKPRALEAKAHKNVSMDIMGDKIGRVHLGKQDLGKLQTRKMKGLKKRFDQVAEDDDVEGDDEVSENESKRAKTE